MPLALDPMDEEILSHLANTRVLIEDLIFALVKDRYPISPDQLHRRLDELVQHGYLDAREVSGP
jgi:DNA-binding HxlR family transcriptional regulator